MATAAVNNVMVVERRLWTLVLAWPGLVGDRVSPPLVKTANMVRYDQASTPQPDKAMMHRQTQLQLPELKLELISGRTNPKAPRTFTIQPYVNDVTFLWTIQGSDKNYNTPTQILAELDACFKTAGTQLGIPAVVAKWNSDFRFGLAANQNATIDQHREAKLNMVVTIKG